MILDQIIGSVGNVLDRFASGMGIRSSADVSCRLEHSGPPQEDRPSKPAERLPTDNKPNVPQPSPDNKTQAIQAWNHQKFSIEQNITDAEQRAIRSQLYYQDIVENRNEREDSINRINTLRRNPRQNK